MEDSRPRPPTLSSPDTEHIEPPASTTDRAPPPTQRDDVEEHSLRTTIPASDSVPHPFTQLEPVTPGRITHTELSSAQSATRLTLPEAGFSRPTLPGEEPTEHSEPPSSDRTLASAAPVPSSTLRDLNVSALPEVAAAAASASQTSISAHRTVSVGESTAAPLAELRETLPSHEPLKRSDLDLPTQPRKAELTLPELPEDAPAWMLHARELTRSLEWAIQSAQPPTPLIQASIERAYEAWMAGGFSCGEIGQVAQLVRQSYRKLRAADTPRKVVVRRECTQDIHQRLPVRVKRWVSLAFVDALLQELDRYGDERIAQLRGTQRLLGWDLSTDRWGEELIRLSIDTTGPYSG